MKKTITILKNNNVSINNQENQENQEKNTNIDNKTISEPSLLAVEVSDRGVGIPSDIQEYLLDNVKTDNSQLNFDGTGIGLTICIKFAQSLGGGITFSSQEGKGTKFVFISPLAMNSN